MSKTPRSKSSSRWLKEHFDDPYVKQAQKAGLRSRAVFKLQEIQEKDRILKPGMTVIDLGAAPGGWSQYASSCIGATGKVIALDILEMEPLPEVEFLQGDFTEQAVFDELLAIIASAPVALVMSDMAPNISGVKGVDQPRAIYLAELAVELAQNVLSKGGDLLIKVFQGVGFEELLATLRQHFARVLTRKPQASRSRSREIYLLAREYKGRN